MTVSSGCVKQQQAGTKPVRWNNTAVAVPQSHQPSSTAELYVQAAADKVDKHILGGCKSTARQERCVLW